jgi:hypothetical protein
MRTSKSTVGRQSYCFVEKYQHVLTGQLFGKCLVPVVETRSTRNAIRNRAGRSDSAPVTVDASNVDLTPAATCAPVALLTDRTFWMTLAAFEIAHSYNKRL